MFQFFQGIIIGIVCPQKEGKNRKNNFKPIARNCKMVQDYLCETFFKKLNLWNLFVGIT